MKELLFEFSFCVVLALTLVADLIAFVFELAIWGDVLLLTHKYIERVNKRFGV